MNFIRIIRADALEDYEKRQQEKKKEKGLKNALETHKKAWNYYTKYYAHTKTEAPKELIDFLMSNDEYAYELVKDYLIRGMQLTNEMKNYFKDHNGMITFYGDIKKDIDIKILPDLCKYIKDPVVALAIAKEFRKKKIEIPENIKKLMIKAPNFYIYMKDFKDFNNDDFLKQLEKNPRTTLDYIFSHGSKKIPESTIINMIKNLDELYSETLIDLIEDKIVDSKYNEIILEKIAKVLKKSSYAISPNSVLKLFKLFGKNLPENIINIILKNEQLLKYIVEHKEEEKIILPQNILDAYIKQCIKNDRLYSLLSNIGEIPQIVLDHYMQDINKAAKLYFTILGAKLKAPKELIDMITSRGSLCYKLYQKAKDYGYKLDKEILDSANAYIQKKMDRE